MGVVPHYFSSTMRRCARRRARIRTGSRCRSRVPAVIDEVQRAPSLMLAVKQILDRRPDARPVPAHRLGRPAHGQGRCRRAPWQGRVREPLAARRRPRSPPGAPRSSTCCSTAPRRGSAGPQRVAPRAPSSSSPAVSRTRGTRTPRQRARYLRSYVQTILAPRPARDRRGPRRPVQARAAAAAARRPHQRARQLRGARARARIDDKTVKAHIELLTQLFLLYRLRPLSANLGARQVKTPKLLLSDTGLAAALVGVDASRYSAPDQGAIAGQAVRDVRRHGARQAGDVERHPVELFFYRDTDKREVDLVIESASGDVVGDRSQVRDSRRRLRHARATPAARQARPTLQARPRRLLRRAHTPNRRPHLGCARLRTLAIATALQPWTRAEDRLRLLPLLLRVFLCLRLGLLRGL